MKLTSKSVPYGYEDRFFIDVLSHILPSDIKKDKHGNYFYEIGDSRTIFASHIDTVSKEYKDVTRKIEGNIVKTDGKSTLGADDKAGMTIMLYMIENKVPGLYYFFIGEEVGCIGSGLVAKHEDIKGNYDRVISFDRRGTDSIITFQSSGRCCSDKFADKLALELNKHNLSYEKDTGGVYTDSAEFVHLVPECTNISVGYYKEHTKDEHQDISHLESLAIACAKVDWESLPVERDPSDIEFPSYGWGSTWDDNYYDRNVKPYPSFQEFYPKRKNKKKKRGRIYLDKGGILQDITNDINKSNVDRYSWILNKICSDKFTISELETIKDTYLDLETDYDNWFYSYLKEQAIDL